MKFENKRHIKFSIFFFCELTMKNPSQKFLCPIATRKQNSRFLGQTKLMDLSEIQQIAESCSSQEMFGALVWQNQFNNFDGKQVITDLSKRKDLWHRSQQRDRIQNHQ